MMIYTKFFGELEAQEGQIIRFENGIPGFEELTDYVILDINENDSLKCLQSIKEKEVCLIMINPWDYFKEYQIELCDDEMSELEVTNQEEVIIYNIITVRGEKITANLVAPIVINIIKNKGKQIILTNTKYNVRQEIECL